MDDGLKQFAHFPRAISNAFIKVRSFYLLIVNAQGSMDVAVAKLAGHYHKRDI